MKLMTYNIRLGIQQGLAEVARVLGEHDPDIVALQEVGRFWKMGPKGCSTSELARLAGFEHFLFVPCIDEAGPQQYGHALLSRFKLTQPRILKLPADVDEPRRLLSVAVDAPDGSFRLFATHLSYIEDRPAQAALLLDQLRDCTQPWLLMGDLNEEADAAWMAKLAELGTLADCETGLTYPSDEPRLRIDHIVVSSGVLDHVAVLQAGDVSDHLPLTATWTLTSS